MTNHPWFLNVDDLRGTYWTNKLIWELRRHGDQGLVVDLSGVSKVFPNGAVPLSAVLAYFTEVLPGVVEVRIGDKSRLAHIGEPLTLESYDRTSEQTLTNSVWKYSSELDAQKLANMFMEALVDQVHCEEGVIDSINWCLYEVMDNVFQHSDAHDGFVMMQLHRERRLCVIAVADTGIGIQKSMAQAGTASLEVLTNPGAVINHSLEKGVTSKGRQNQGNGLFGLRRAVEINGGQLSVRSGRGVWQLREGNVDWTSDYASPLPDAIDHQSTLIDWQLDCSQKVRIDEALGGREHPSEFLESIEDEEGVHRVSVNEIEEALGSRKLGSEIRTRLENYLNAGAKFVVLDFKGVGVVSSSFADEVLAKLASSMGELEFRRRVFIDSASPTNRSLIETAIGLRLGRSEEPAP